MTAKVTRTVYNANWTLKFEFIQYDGHYIIREYERHGRAWSYLGSYRREGVAPVEDNPKPAVSQAKLESSGDDSFKAHRERLDNDINYRDWYERGGMMRLEDRKRQ